MAGGGSVSSVAAAPSLRAASASASASSRIAPAYTGATSASTETGLLQLL